MRSRASWLGAVVLVSSVLAWRSSALAQPKAKQKALAKCPAGMVRVAAGTFEMGSPGVDDEQPPHKVTLSSYCIDKTEVTVKAFGRCVAAGKCGPAAGASKYCNGDLKERATHPVNCVSWDNAAKYCGWAGNRLPTEAEWEYAARGKDGRTYPWGNEEPGPKRLNACGTECRPLFSADSMIMYEGDDRFGATAPVGKYPAGKSPWGALDMAGNVKEWTADWYGPYAAGDATDPTGPESGTSHVSRGGDWSNGVAFGARASYRYGDNDPEGGSFIGFRCVRGAR